MVIWIERIWREARRLRSATANAPDIRRCTTPPPPPLAHWPIGPLGTCTWPQRDREHPPGCEMTALEIGMGWDGMGGGDAYLSAVGTLQSVRGGGGVCGPSAVPE